MNEGDEVQEREHVPRNQWERAFSDESTFQNLMLEIHNDVITEPELRCISQYLSKRTVACNLFLKHFWCHIPASDQVMSGEARLLNSLIWYLTLHQRTLIVAKLSVLNFSAASNKDARLPWLVWFGDRLNVDTRFLIYMKESAFPDILVNSPIELLHIAWVLDQKEAKKSLQGTGDDVSAETFIVDCLLRHEYLFEQRLSYDFLKALLLPHSFYEAHSNELTDRFTREQFLKLASSLRTSALPFLLRVASKHLLRFLSSAQESRILSMILCIRVLDKDADRNGLQLIFETLSKMTVASCTAAEADTNLLEVVTRNISHDQVLYRNLCLLLGKPANELIFLSTHLCRQLEIQGKLEDLANTQEQQAEQGWKQELTARLRKTQIPEVVEFLNTHIN